jgi:hypothetical protein
VLREDAARVIREGLLARRAYRIVDRRDGRLGFQRSRKSANHAVLLGQQVDFAELVEAKAKNAQIAHLVTPANFLKDVNANGILTVSDKLITNSNVTKALPAP